MELKVLCNCGQKFKFDVVPVDGRVPFQVNCPICGIDGTSAANQVLAESLPTPPPVPATTTTASRLQINHPPTASAAPAPRPPIPVPAQIAPASPRTAGEFNLGMGILGAVIGAAVGVGLMYAFFQFAGFRFPLVGVGIGILTGWSAKLLGKGSDQILAIICGGIALVSVVGAIYLMYGEFPPMNIISALISTSMAYRIAMR